MSTRPEKTPSERLVARLGLHPILARELADEIEAGSALALVEALRAKADGPPSRRDTISLTPSRPDVAALRARNLQGGHIDAETAEKWAKGEAAEWERLYGEAMPGESNLLVTRALKALAFRWTGENPGERFRKRFNCDTVEEAVRDAVRPWPADGWRGAEVGNTKFGPTPRAPKGSKYPPRRRCNTPVDLYRLLYLFNPVAVDFDDMYGDGLFGLTSPCRRFAMSFYFHKYELAAYQFVAADLARRTRPRGAIEITSGIPGVNNGVATTGPSALAWFGMIDKALCRRWDVYPGNDFAV